MIGKMNLQEALNWGISQVTERDQGKQIGVPATETKNEMPVDRV